MQDHPVALQTVATLPDHIADILVKRVGKRHMQDKALVEEGEGPDALCAIDGLVRHDKVSRLDLFGERARRGKGNDGPHAQFPQRGDVGSHGDLRRVVFVVDAVARHKRNGDRLPRRRRGVLEDRDRRRRLAPWRVDVYHRDLGEVLQRVESCPSDHGDVHRVCSSRIAKWVSKEGIKQIPPRLIDGKRTNLDMYLEAVFPPFRCYKSHRRRQVDGPQIWWWFKTLRSTAYASWNINLISDFLTFNQVLDVT